MSDLFPGRIETERLRLERFDESVDLFELYEVLSGDPGIEAVTRHMSWDPHEHPSESREFVDRMSDHWEDGDLATYAVRPAAGEDGAGEFAGLGSLRVDWDRRVGTLGIWLRKRFWGRGYSGERAGALFELAFERLDLPLVSVYHGVDNDRSRRAVEKYVERFGGRREGTLRNYLPFGEPRDGVRYTVAREEWSENRPGGLQVSLLDG